MKIFFYFYFKKSVRLLIHFFFINDTPPLFIPRPKLRTMPT